MSHTVNRPFGTGLSHTVNHHCFVLQKVWFQTVTSYWHMNNSGNVVSIEHPLHITHFMSHAILIFFLNIMSWYLSFTLRYMKIFTFGGIVYFHAVQVQPQQYSINPNISVVCPCEQIFPWINIYHKIIYSVPKPKM